MTLRSIRHSSVLLLATTAFAATPAHAADDAPKAAWGKAGVSYEQYRSDAYDCALDGLSTDISHTAPVERLRSASRQLEAADSQFSASASADSTEAGIRQAQEAGIRHAQETAAIRAGARPEQQVKAVKEIIFAATQRCMARHGYVRFALTEAQRGEIARLKEHSQEWRTYLHKLASDGAIVEQQKEPLPEG